MKSKLYFSAILIAVFCSSALAQLTLPRDSQRADVMQTVGDTKISLTYHRPNIKGRKVWGEPVKEGDANKTQDGSTMTDKTAPLVAYGIVWRTGANENTTFETSNDIKINGQTLPAGKYGLHSIPGPNEWTLIFNKVNNAWGSFSYDATKDQLRVTAKPQKVNDFEETLWLGLENIKPTTADFVIRWENVRVPFTIDVGDMDTRVLAYIRQQMATLKADDMRSAVDAASYIMDKKLTGNYQEAIGWLDASLKNKETAGLLVAKANLQAETGNKAEAIKNLERAIAVAKAANPKANTAGLEKRLADWKAGK